MAGYGSVMLKKPKRDKTDLCGDIAPAGDLAQCLCQADHIALAILEPRS